MGCSFSQNTYLYSNQGNMIHSPSKVDAQRIKGNEMHQIKSRSNLRMANKIYAENYFSASNSLLETDKEMCSFMEMNQKNLQKSKLGIYQSQDSSKKVMESQMEKNQNSNNSTNRSDTLSKNGQSANEKRQHSWGKIHKKDKFDQASDLSMKIIKSQLILQKDLIEDSRDERSSQPEMLTFSRLESINLAIHSPKKQHQIQAVASIMERSLFLNSNQNAKHELKKKKIMNQGQNQDSLFEHLYVQESQIKLEIKQSEIQQPHYEQSNKSNIKRVKFQNKNFLSKNDNSSIFFSKKNSKAVAKTQRKSKKLL